MTVIFDLGIASIFVIFGASAASFMISMALTDRMRSAAKCPTNSESPISDVSLDHDHCHSSAHVDHNVGVALDHGKLSTNLADQGVSVLLSSFTRMLIKSFSAGTLLGLVTMHLLADAHENLLDLYPDYPLALVVFSVGCILTLGVDEIALALISVHVNNSFQAPGHIERQFDMTGEKECTHYTCALDDKCGLAAEGGVSRNTNMLQPVRTSAIPSKVLNYDEQRTLAKAYMLEAGVAVHGITMGFGMGALTNSGNIAEFEVLFLVYVLHQVFEGIGLGAVMSESCLSRNMKITFGIFFALTLPLGIAIGLGTTSTTEGETVGMANGCANAIAAGSILYTSLVEMAGEDFHAVKKDQVFLKVGMYLALSLGFIIMAVLAIWA